MGYFNMAAYNTTACTLPHVHYTFCETAMNQLVYIRLNAILTKRMNPQGNNDHPIIYVCGLEANWIPQGIYKDELAINKYLILSVLSLTLY